MDKQEALQIFNSTGALQTGHFLLTSGLHSPQYFQCAQVLQYPKYLEMFCKDIIEFYYEDDDFDLVIAPAIGGITVGQELARQLNVRFIFSERENGKMTLRRGFQIAPHEKVLIAEDVITTGGSVKEVLEIVEEAKGYPIGIGTIVDRSNDGVTFDVPLYASVQVKSVAYPAEKCPLCKQKIPLVKPGSRSK
jgi:orotate phosphoribosyltransferase